MSISHFSTTESLILRNGIFAVGGLIVDMDTPGIGLWNHTLPADAPNGAVWSEDVLWLEPVSACVDTNLTVDYTLHDIGSINDAKTFNITDSGGFFNLTPDYPSFIPDGQNVNLGWHAYRRRPEQFFYDGIVQCDKKRELFWTYLSYHFHRDVVYRGQHENA
jgi:hypothetical protein